MLHWPALAIFLHSAAWDLDLKSEALPPLEGLLAASQLEPYTKVKWQRSLAPLPVLALACAGAPVAKQHCSMFGSHVVCAVLVASWAEAPIKIAKMTLTIKLDGNWSSFQLANNTPPLSVTGSVIAPSARIQLKGTGAAQGDLKGCGTCLHTSTLSLKT